MLRSALTLLACAALAFAGCGPKRPPARSTAVSHSPRPGPTSPALRYEKPEAAAILATGLAGAAAAHPLATLCYADFALDTADLLDLAPRYDRPVVAGLFGAGLGGTAAAGPWHQIVYLDVAASSFDLLRPQAPPARPSRIVTRTRRAPTAVASLHPLNRRTTTVRTVSLPSSRPTTVTTRPSSTTRTTTTTRPTTTRTTTRTTTIRTTTRSRR